MSINTFKEFASNPNVTLEEFKTFYYTKFPAVFSWFYPSQHGNMILFAERIKNDYRSLSSKIGKEEQYFFSAAVFFHVLIPQVIIRIAGRNAFDLFIKSSAWPRFSAGMGGPVSAEQWLQESDLIPLGKEVSYYNALLDITLPFFQSELSSFFRGDQQSADNESYATLCELYSGKVSVILNEIASATIKAESHFKDGCHQVYYLTEEEIKER